MDVDLETIKLQCQAHWNVGEGSDTPLNYLRLSASIAVKIGSIFCESGLQAELPWYLYLVDRLPRNVVVPRPYFQSLVEADDLLLLIMEPLDGETVQQFRARGGQLDQPLIDRLAHAYDNFQSGSPPKAQQLCPSSSWMMRGKLFLPDGDGYVTIQSLQELDDLMNERLRRARDRDGNALRECDVILNPGDPPESNLILMSGNRVGFVDLPDAVWARAYWGMAALDATPGMHPGLMAAFKDTRTARGCVASAAVQNDLIDLRGWYRSGGKGWLR